jgi:hypothetical protein
MAVLALAGCPLAPAKRDCWPLAQAPRSLAQPSRQRQADQTQDRPSLLRAPLRSALMVALPAPRLLVAQSDCPRAAKKAPLVPIAPLRVAPIPPPRPGLPCPIHPPYPAAPAPSRWPLAVSCAAAARAAAGQPLAPTAPLHLASPIRHFALAHWPEPLARAPLSHRYARRAGSRFP